MKREEFKRLSEYIKDEYPELLCPECGIGKGYIEPDAEETCCNNCNIVFRVDDVLKFETIDDLKYFIWDAVGELMDLDYNPDFWRDK